MKHPLIIHLTELFEAQADMTLKPRQEAYMRSQFSFFGVNKTKRLAIQKIVFKTHPIKTIEELTEIVRALWQLQTREYLYTAFDILQHNKKLWTPEIVHLFEYCITTASWWDTVDNLAANCVGPLCTQFPALKEIMHRWISADNLWLRSTALLFQLRYKTRTDTNLLFAYCIKTMHEKDFFMRKAIGWALREYSKTDPKAVHTFVAAYRDKLSPLSIREALRRIESINTRKIEHT